MNFYDTCSLLDLGCEVFETNDLFYISSITLKELENIKSNKNKTEDLRFKCRKILRLLNENVDKYKIISYHYDWDSEFITLYPSLTVNDDSRIILTAKKVSREVPSLVFVTNDFSCRISAFDVGLKVSYLQDEEDYYRGYKEIQLKHDEEYLNFAEKVLDRTQNYFDLKLNEYLLVKDEKGEIFDIYKYCQKGIDQLTGKNYPEFKSKMFGITKPKDYYQQIAMDSLLSNRITLLRGPAGSGKSWLAMTYLFSLLEKGTIDHIVIFCNTVATAGAAKLGFYPGSKDEKLLDAQIGNFLTSKIGDKEVVRDYIDNGTIMLLPMSDIRGFDTSGMKAGVYITEAQNMDVELMRLALQRIGDDAICILDGDDNAQVDMGIYAGNNNGLRRVSQVFRGELIYGEVTLPNIYRSEIARIAQRM